MIGDTVKILDQSVVDFQDSVQREISEKFTGSTRSRAKDAAVVAMMKHLYQRGRETGAFLEPFKISVEGTNLRFGRFAIESSTVVFDLDNRIRLQIGIEGLPG